MRLNIGLAAGLAFAVAASAHAAPTAQDAAAEAATARLAKVSGAYVALSQEALQLILFDIDGAGKALQLASSGGDADATKSWAATWEAQLDTKLATLKADLAAMPSNAGALDDFGRFAPAAAAKMRTVDVPGRTRDIVESVIELSTSVRGDIEPALSNQLAAKKRLSIDLITGLKGELGAENGLMIGAIGMLEEAHPQRALISSILASNEAMIGIYDGVLSQLQGQPVDMKALAASTHKLCGEARTNAEQVAPLAVAMRGRIDAHGHLPPDTQARWFQAWDSFSESGQVEVALADQCEKVAGGLDQNLPIMQAVEQASELKTLVDRRIALDNARRATLAEGH